MGKLTALKVKNAKPGKHGDGDGLMLVVSNTGARKWVLRIKPPGGKRVDLGLGSAADVSLMDARETARELRRRIKRGEPVDSIRRSKQKTPTFLEAAKQVHAEHLPSWKNAKHADQWITSLETYAFPVLGDMPVDQIGAPMIRDVLAEIWLMIPETARRVHQRIGTVLDFAHAKGWREQGAPVRAVTRGLPKQPKIRQHLAAMPWRDVPGFVASLPNLFPHSEALRLALEFTILTGVRSGEARGARWNEIDFKAQTWTVPAERMKGGREHRVPLSRRAIEILARMHEMRRSDALEAAVFEGRKPGEPVSDMTLIKALRRAGVTVTVHGFRSSFRDWCGEATNTPREVAEACLAHKVGGVEGAYARTDHLDKRRPVMEMWAQYVVGVENNVVPLARA